MLFQHTAARRRLGRHRSSRFRRRSFNTQPPEGGWLHIGGQRETVLVVSTHSRPKAAGAFIYIIRRAVKVSTHSRPKAAGFLSCSFALSYSFQHTAARRRLEDGGIGVMGLGCVSTHSRPKAAGFADPMYVFMDDAFQHTAARRRLACRLPSSRSSQSVSTHSRPKAAG